MARTRTRVRVRGNSDLGFGLGLLGLGLELGLGSGLEFGLEPGSGLELWLGYEQKSYCANTYVSMAFLVILCVHQLLPNMFLGCRRMNCRKKPANASISAVHTNTFVLQCANHPELGKNKPHK